MRVRVRVRIPVGFRAFLDPKSYSPKSSLPRSHKTTQPDADCYNLTLTHKVLDWDQNQVPIHDWRTPTRNARRKLLQAQDNAEGSVHIALLQLLIHLRPVQSKIQHKRVLEYLSRYGIR